MSILIITLFLPLLALIIVFLLSFFINDKALCKISLWFISLSTFFNIILLFLINKDLIDFQFQERFFFIPTINFEIILGIDGISI